MPRDGPALLDAAQLRGDRGLVHAPITTTGRTGSGTRETLAVFDDHRGAQAVVDRLSDAGFPVLGVQITGTGLRAVEYVTGRVTRGRAAARGAVSGPGVGLLLGAPVFAAGWGAVFGYVGQWTTGGRRDFSSVSGFEADRFEVSVGADHIDRARDLIA